MQWYPGDWLKDPAVRILSYAARGLWSDMLSLMFECDPKGYLAVSPGKPVTGEDLSQMLGGSPAEVSQLLQEIEDSGAFSRTDEGVIYSRRMVRDEQDRAKAKKRMARIRGKDPPIASERERAPDVRPEFALCSEEEEEEEEQSTSSSDKEGGCRGGEKTAHGPGAEPIDELSPEWIAREFCFLYAGTSQRERDVSLVSPVFRDLIARGVSARELLETVKAKDRRKSEFLWQFCKRWDHEKRGVNGHTRYGSARYDPERDG